MNSLKHSLKGYLERNREEITLPSYPEVSKKKPKLGDIVQIICCDKIFIAVAIDQFKSYIMSEFWELATPNDIIVSTECLHVHKWLVETDQVIYFNLYLIYNIVGSLDKEYKQIVKCVYKSKEFLVKQFGSIVNSKDQMNCRDPRSKFKKEEAKKVLELNKHLYYS